MLDDEAVGARTSIGSERAGREGEGSRRDLTSRPSFFTSFLGGKSILYKNNLEKTIHLEKNA